MEKSKPREASKAASPPPVDAMARDRVGDQVELRTRARCPFCHDDIAAELKKWGCPQCMAWHHSECHEDHGRCASCGHSEAPDQPAIASRDAGSRDAGPVSCRKDSCSEPRLTDPATGEALAPLCAIHARRLIRTRGLLMAPLLFFGLPWLILGTIATIDGELFARSMALTGLVLVSIAAWLQVSRRRLDQAELRASSRIQPRAVASEGASKGAPVDESGSAPAAP